MTDLLDDLARHTVPADMGQARIAIEEFIRLYNAGEAELLDIRVPAGPASALEPGPLGLKLDADGPGIRALFQGRFGEGLEAAGLRDWWLQGARDDETVSRPLAPEKVEQCLALNGQGVLLLQQALAQIRELHLGAQGVHLRGLATGDEGIHAPELTRQGLGGDAQGFDQPHLGKLPVVEA